VWENSPLSRSKGAKPVQKTIFNAIFWSCAEKIISICESIIEILRMVDYNVACMGFVYESMDWVREHISLICKNDNSVYNPIWGIVEKRWCMLHTPLHVAGLFLAPNYFHIPKDRDIMERFIIAWRGCIMILRYNIKYEYNQYHICKGLVMLSLQLGLCEISTIQRSPLLNSGFPMDMRHFNYKHFQSGC